MKVLLIYPEFPETYWSFKHALAFEGKRSAFPPLGLLTISAMLPQIHQRSFPFMNIQPLTEMDSGNNTDCSSNFIPRMNAARLVEGYKQILRTIYDSHKYYKRALNCLARVVQDAPEPRRAGLASEAASLARVVLKLGIVDGERREFWRFMRRAFAEHREHFAQAVMLAAMGYHFRKLTEEYCR